MSDEKLKILDEKLKKLNKILEDNLDNLSHAQDGAILRNSKYEELFCEVLNLHNKDNIKFQNEPNTTYDCIWNGVELELKRGNFWIDLTRYINEPSENSVTLFIKPNSSKAKKRRINFIYIMKTIKLREALFSDKKIINKISSIKNFYQDKKPPLKLNMQLNLSNDFFELQELDYKILSPEYKPRKNTKYQQIKHQQ